MSNLPRAAVAVDISEAFRTAMAEAGIITNAPVVADGLLHRIHVEGDRAGTRNGWFVLHADGVPAGAFGSWKGVTGTWAAHNTMSWAERAQHRDRVVAATRAANLERERSQANAGSRAALLWDGAHPADPAHPYLVAKRVGVHGLRQHGDDLLVPVCDINGKLMSLQRISPSGEKRFLAGGRIRGGMYQIGNAEFVRYVNAAVLVFAEGFATGATIREVTGLPVFVAFNAGNLKAVALEVLKGYDRHPYIIASDNDHQTPGNPGLTKAREAAKVLGHAWVIAPPSEPGVSDWNDWFLRDGPAMIEDVFPGWCARG